MFIVLLGTYLYPTFNTWIYIAFTWRSMLCCCFFFADCRRSGPTLSIFLFNPSSGWQSASYNFKQYPAMSSYSPLQTAGGSSQAKLWIGARASSLSQTPFNGYMSQLRV